MKTFKEFHDKAMKLRDKLDSNPQSRYASKHVRKEVKDTFKEVPKGHGTRKDASHSLREFKNKLNSNIKDQKIQKSIQLLKQFSKNS